MKPIKQSFEIWEQNTSGKPTGIITSPETIQESLLLGVYKQIERASRICYKSEDKITENSAKEFVDKLIKSKHYAMLEHGTIYLELPCDSNRTLDYQHNKYSKVIMDGTTYSITTNYRVIIENHWEDDLEYICSPTEFHAKRVTVHCTTSLLVAMELLRHRVMSFAMESTRYCNYSKNKFSNELTFIQPCWDTHSPVLSGYGDTFKEALQKVEWSYNRLIELGWLPQQAATILPKALKTELVITGFIDDWRHLFDLRVLGTTGAPHPQMKELMTPVYEEFKKLGYVKS